MSLVTKLHFKKEDSISKDEDVSFGASPIFSFYIRPCLAEFLAVAFYTYLSGICQLSSISTWHTSISISLVQGLVISLFMLAIGHISGAHLNPSVTLSCLLSGGISFSLSIFYFICQFFGGFIGALFIRAVLCRPGDVIILEEVTSAPIEHTPDLYLQIKGGVPDVNLDITSRGQAILSELLSMTLVNVVYLLTVLDSEGGTAGRSSAAVGLAYTVGTWACYPITGGSLNIARTLGTAGAYAIFDINGGIWRLHWVYWIACILSSTLSASIYKLFLASESHRLNPVLAYQQQQ